jgi:hypothetical protein
MRFITEAWLEQVGADKGCWIDGIGMCMVYGGSVYGDVWFGPKDSKVKCMGKVGKIYI